MEKKDSSPSEVSQADIDKSTKMSVLHKVEDFELEAVNKWLELYMPESWALYSLTMFHLKGQWSGHSFFTFGWPSIRGLVTGQDIESDHPCPVYFSARHLGFLFARKDEDVEILLNIPGAVDWSKPLLLRGLPERVFRPLDKMARTRGLDKLGSAHVQIFVARPGDIHRRTIPKGYKIRPFKGDTKIDYCVSKWEYRKPNLNEYFRALASRLPSVCLANEQDVCVSFELGTEFGFIGFLHTREEWRGKGLAKVVMSHLAEEYFKLDLAVYSVVYIQGRKRAVLFVTQSIGFYARSRAVL